MTRASARISPINFDARTLQSLGQASLCRVLTGIRTLVHPFRKTHRRLSSIKSCFLRVLVAYLGVVIFATAIEGNIKSRKILVHPKNGPDAYLSASTNDDRGSGIYKACSESVFVLYVKSSSGNLIAQGSGFLVADKKIITNAHVVRGGDVFVQLGPARVATHLIRTDQFNDLALLSVDADILVRPLIVATSSPEPGDIVFAISNPENLERSISEGIVSAIRNFNGRQLLQITTPISHGSSGGPILDKNGVVVGVAVGTLADGENLNFAVPAADVRAIVTGGNTLQSANINTTLERVHSLVNDRNNEKFSAEADSPWQVKTTEIKTLLQHALDQAGSNPEAIIKVAKEAFSEDSDFAILAARRANSLKSSSDGQLILAKALTFKAIFERGDEQRKEYVEAERAARAALSGTRTPTGEMYYALADVLEDEAKYVEALSSFNLALSKSTSESNPDLEFESKAPVHK